MKNAPKLPSEQCRAVYELIRTGQLLPHMAPLYPHAIRALAQAGMITRTPDGGFEAPAVLVDGRRTPSAPPPPPKPVLVNLNVRVPKEVLEGLDLLGENRSDSARTILMDGLRRTLEARTAPENGNASESGTHTLRRTANESR
jgi:hypothetical protein